MLDPGLPAKRHGSVTWARLISKVFYVDPLACAKCGGKLEIIAYLRHQVSISKILDHLGLSPPETAKPTWEMTVCGTKTRHDGPATETDAPAKG